jgi:hypothetical protein
MPWVRATPHGIHRTAAIQAPRRRICTPLICEWVKAADGRMLTSSREHNLEK